MSGLTMSNNAVFLQCMQQNPDKDEVTWTEVKSWIDPEMRAAIVGAAFVIVGVWLTARFDESDDDEKEFLEFQAWLNGLWAELRHIKRRAIVEIQRHNLNKGVASTKRLNSDFIERSRLALFEYDEDACFLEALTNAYRDIVHTNGMLDRLEKWQTECRKRANSKFKSRRIYFRRSLKSTKESFKGVRGSITRLKVQIRRKLKDARSYERRYLRNKLTNLLLFRRRWWFPPTWQDWQRKQRRRRHDCRTQNYELG
jgi:hypothetical protein